MNMTISGEGTVLPPGSGQPAATLPEGTYQITLDGFCDSGMVRCVYPCGFVKHHQAETVEELALKIANQIKARYGATDVPFAKVPKAIKEGEQFVVEG